MNTENNCNSSLERHSLPWSQVRRQHVVEDSASPHYEVSMIPPWKAEYNCGNLSPSSVRSSMTNFGCDMTLVDDERVTLANISPPPPPPPVPVSAAAALSSCTVSSWSSRASSSISGSSLDDSDDDEERVDCGSSQHLSECSSIFLSPEEAHDIATMDAEETHYVDLRGDNLDDADMIRRRMPPVTQISFLSQEADRQDDDERLRVGTAATSSNVPQQKVSPGTATVISSTCSSPSHCCYYSDGDESAHRHDDEVLQALDDACMAWEEHERNKGLAAETPHAAAGGGMEMLANTAPFSAVRSPQVRETFHSLDPMVTSFSHLGEKQYNAPPRTDLFISQQRNFLRDNTTGTTRSVVDSSVFLEQFLPIPAPPSSMRREDFKFQPPLQALTALFLPEEMIFAITSFLDAPSLLRLRAVNKELCNLASRDEAGWAHLCTSLWNTKIHVGREARALLHNRRAMSAYRSSVYDGMSRNEITADELCFDPQQQETTGGTVWSFRFKESAGPDWTSWDPWWNGTQARKMVFLRNGTVMQLDTTTASTETGRYSTNSQHKSPNFVLRNVFSDAAAQQQQQQNYNNWGNHHNLRRQNNPAVIPPQIEMKWRFISKPMDLPSRPGGAYIRLTLGGRDVPTYVVRRSPTGNWGFVMESCWGVYSSFDLPPRRQREVMLGNDVVMMDPNRIPRPVVAVPPSRPSIRRRGRTRIRLRRTRDGGRWLNVDGIESDSDEEDDQDNDSSSHQPTIGDNASDDNNTSANRDTGVSLMMDDAAMTITNVCQWREALLYNFGATSLPEGEGATQEFDRVWGEALRTIHGVGGDEHFANRDGRFLEGDGVDLIPR